MENQFFLQFGSTMPRMRARRRRMSAFERRRRRSVSPADAPGYIYGFYIVGTQKIKVGHTLPHRLCKRPGEWSKCEETGHDHLWFPNPVRVRWRRRTGEDIRLLEMLDASAHRSNRGARAQTTARTGLRKACGVLLSVRAKSHRAVSR